MSKLIEIQPVVQENGFTGTDGKVSFDGVYVAAPNNDGNPKNVSMNSPGTITAIVGPSGSGKSSL